jgi:ADP-heptose:LPS heptosyltransferase
MQRDGQGVLQEYFQRVRQKRCEFFCFDPNYQGKASRFFFEATVKRFAGRSGVETEFEKYIRLPLSDDQRKRGFNLLRPLPRPGRDFIVVHPGSGSREKCWPLENFLEIVQKLATLGFAGAVVTGEAEERMEKELAAASLPGDWLWLRQPPLLGLAGLLASSRLYLGNDSGVTHLAAACGTPVVAIFKKAFELQWSPYGQTSILSGAELSTITIASVQRQILQFFGLRA